LRFLLVCVWWPKRDNLLVFQVPKCLPLGLLNIFLIHDVVAIKDTPRFVTTDLHSNPFRHSCPYHVPHRSSPEVMEELTRHTSFPTGLLPCFIKSPKILAIAMKHIRHQVSPVEPPAVNDLRNHPCNHEYPYFAGFGLFRPEPDGILLNITPPQ